MPTKMIQKPDITKLWPAIVNLGIILVALWATSFHSYILFHTLAEIASVVLAVSIFLVSWNTRRYWNNNYFILIGFGFLFSGVIDLIHAFEYKGVGIILSEGNTNVATQLWLAGRFVIVLSFLAAPFISNRKTKAITLFSVFAFFTGFLLLSIFYWKNFPTAYLEGIGLTTFKRISEYAIIALFLGAFANFYRLREKFHKRVFHLLSLVMIIMALAEFSFTLYVGVYDIFNLLGHLLRISAYYLAYLGIVEYGLMSPYSTLFKDLKDKEAVLMESEERYRSLVEFSPDAVVVYDKERIRYANEAAADLFGIKDKAMLIGKPFVKLFHRDYHFLIQQRLQKIESGELDRTPLAEMKIVRPDGATVDVEIKGMKIIFDRKPAIESIISDISQRKRDQEKINHLASFPLLNPNPVIEIDSKGELTYANAAASTVLKKMGIEEDVRIFFPGDLREILSELRDSTIDKVLYREITIKHRVFSQSIQLSKQFNVVRLYITDITKRKYAEEKMQRTMNEWILMFNSISDPAFILDANHTVKHVNKAMCAFAGMSEEKLVGRKCFDFMHRQRNPWETCPLKKTVESKETHSEEIYDPSIGKILLITTSPILDNDGKITGILHIAKDITEKKKVERAKDEFISLASHQLRTPLSSISLASELLLRSKEIKNDPEQKELLDEVRQSTKRMSFLISHMLNVSRIELGTLVFNPEPMDISKRINEIAGELEPQIAEKKLALKKDFEPGLPVITFDDGILRIIVENLLTNSIRYTPSGGTITISTAWKESNIVFSVTDTGCGIPEKDQKKIFQKSFRAENAKLISSDGYGLGMYMVKEVAEMAGAKIRFISEENKGTTFFVSFPIAKKGS